MRRGVTHRQGGQTIVLAAIALVAVVGGLAMVIDTGMFFVIQRQFQSAADAGALAGAWHDPICPNAVGFAPPCIPSPATPVMVGTMVGSPQSCVAPPPVGVAPSCAPCLGPPGVYTACDVALANAESINPLCNGTLRVIVGTGTTLVRPSNVNVLVVFVQCDAGYSFGRILNLTTKTVSASSAAALGNRNATPPACNNGGDMTDLSASAACGYIARLIE